MELRVPAEQLARIDSIVSEARKRYQRVPRQLRSRPAVIRAALDGGLGALEARVWARSIPPEESLDAE